jgi:hypothetical protein
VSLMLPAAAATMSESDAADATVAREWLRATMYVASLASQGLPRPYRYGLHCAKRRVPMAKGAHGQA